jgi:hypothetical protein
MSNEVNSLVPLSAAAPAVSSSSASSFLSASSSRSPLYRDALASVLAFLSLRELAAALTVNKEWSAAVLSMRPALLTADVTFSHVPALASSPLRRHVGELGQMNEDCEHKLWLSSNELSVLFHALPQLPSLNAAVQPGDAPLLFPARLQRLNMRVLNPPEGSEWVNAVVESIGQLQQLHTLCLDLQHAVASLSSLQRLPLLREFHLTCPIPNPRQTAVELRALPWLHRLYIYAAASPSAHGNALFTALLRDPPEQDLSTLKWRDFSINTLFFTNEVTPLLARLPSLERLEITVSRCTRFDFLATLPRLTTLELSLWRMQVDAWRNLLAVFTSHGVTRLQTLALTGGPCTSDELRQLLSHTPSLTCIVLHSLSAVDSLAFFRQLPTLAATLTRLTVECTISWGLTAADLPPLHALRQLRELRLLRWTDMEADGFAKMDIAPFDLRPCSVLPQLEVFEWTTR